MDRGLALTRLGVAATFVFWVLLLAGQVYDVVHGVGANSLTYVEPHQDGGLRVRDFAVPGDELNGLHIGDHVVLIGDDATLPVDQMGFRHAIAHAQGRLLVRRNGLDVPLEFPLEPKPFPFAGVVKNLFLGALGIVALMFGPRSALASLTAICAFTFAHAGSSAPIGPSSESTQAFVVVYAISGSIVFPAGLNLVQLLTGERRPGALAAAWLLAPLGVSYLSMFHGGPVPPSLAFGHLYLCVTVCLCGCLWLLIRGVGHAHGRQRHRINWVLGSVFLMAVGIAISWIFHAVRDPVAGSVAARALHEWFLLLPGVGILLAILKADYAEIDHTAARAATWATLLVSLALTFEFVLEPVAGLLAAGFGLAESTGQTLLIVVAALGGPALKSRVQPLADRWLAPVEGDD